MAELQFLRRLVEAQETRLSWYQVAHSRPVLGSRQRLISRTDCDFGEEQQTAV